MAEFEKTGTLRQRTLATLARYAGRTDRELAELVSGRGSPQQPINLLCRHLEASGLIERRKRDDGLIGNYLRDGAASHPLPKPSAAPRASDPPNGWLSEDDVKRHVVAWLEERGWRASVAWAKDRGIDIEATREGERWIIEAKGGGSLQPMRVNYFIAILGELLQRMNDPQAGYSIALPDMPQFRGLWQRLPDLAKQRTRLSALFVATDGTIIFDAGA